MSAHEHRFADVLSANAFLESGGPRWSVDFHRCTCGEWQLMVELHQATSTPQSIRNATRSYSRMLTAEQAETLDLFHNELGALVAQLEEQAE